MRQTDMNPRKRPRQERSRQTVAAIMQSAAQVLTRHGCDGMTTARVAERAGASIGSIYQYFPNKEALIAGLIDDHSDEILSAIRVVTVEARYSRLVDGLRALIRAVLSVHSANPTLHKVLIEQVPHVGRQSLAMATYRTSAGYIENLLRQHSDKIAVGTDFTMASAVIQTLLEALIHRAVIDQSQLLDRDVFEREVMSLIGSYLMLPSHETAALIDHLPTA